MKKATTALAAAIMTFGLMTTSPVEAKKKATKPAVTVKTVVGKDRVVYQKVTRLSFTGSTLLGKTEKPDGMYMILRRKTLHKSLIKMRRSFRDRIMKTAHSM